VRHFHFLSIMMREAEGLACSEPIGHELAGGHQQIDLR